MRQCPIQFLLPSLALRLQQAGSRSQFSLGLILAVQSQQHSPTKIMEAVIARVDLEGRIQFRQRGGIFALLVENLRQAKERTGQPRIQLQRLAKILLCRTVFPQMPIDGSQAVVVKRHVWFQGNVFQKLISRVRVIFVVGIDQSEIEVRKRQVRLHLYSLLELCDSLVVLFAVQMRLAHKQVKFGRVAADRDQLCQRLLLYILSVCLTGRVPQNIKVAELCGLFVPERIEGVHGIAWTVGEEITETQQVTRLARCRLVL